MVIIYVAGQFSKREQLHEIMIQFRERGHFISYDWTHHVSQDQNKTAEQFGQEALVDFQGVEKADVVVAFMDDIKYAYRGTFSELGAAIVLKKRIFVVTPKELQNKGSFFWNTATYHHPLIQHVDNKEIVFQALLN